MNPRIPDEIAPAPERPRAHAEPRAQGPWEWPEPAPLQAPAQQESAERWSGPTYYGMAALKPPPWKGYVPAYLYVGGLAGAGAVLAGCARGPELQGLQRRARAVAVVGVPLGTALLVADMRRPERFLHMLRVFRPTSVINLGSWLLLLGGTANVGALLPGRAGRAFEVPSVLAGALVATYTGALLSNTAVPLWNRARISLPFVFASSAASSTACLLLPLAQRPRERRVLRRLVVGGALAELASKELLHREVGESHARDALRRDAPGFWWKTSRALGVATAATALLMPRQRWLVAALGTAAAAAGRYAIHEAGLRSAKDPRAAFEPRG